MLSSLGLMTLAGTLMLNSPKSLGNSEDPLRCAIDKKSGSTVCLEDAQPSVKDDRPHTTKLHSARAPLRPTSSHAQAAERPARRSAPTAESNPPADASSEEEERDWGMGAELLVASRFLWRGQFYGQGPVLQPSVWASYRGFEMSFWGNIQAMPSKERGLSVFAPALSYTFASDWGSFGAGGALYLETLNQDQPPTAGEFYVNASFDYKMISLRTTQYMHYLGKPGAYYAEAGPALTWENTSWSFGANLDLAWASPRYNGFYFGRAVGGFNLITLQASLARALGKVAYIQVQGETNRLLRDALHIRKSAWVASGSLSLGLDF